MYISLVQLVAAIVLLLYAVRMVRTAVERSYAAQLRRAMAYASGNKLAAAGAGILIAIALQSSTAVALLAAGFAGSGLMTATTGIGVMLGANFGSAVVASVLSLDLSWLTPVLIIIGGVMFLRGNSRSIKQSGRLVIGAAFMLISLEMMSESTAAWRESAIFVDAVSYLQNDLITAFLLAAVVTWIIPSSVASILLIASFGTHGLVSIEMAAAMVLGSNVGGATMAVALTRAGDIRGRRIPLGNAILKTGLGVILLFVLIAFKPPLELLPLPAGYSVMGFHLAFNLLLVVLCLPFTAQTQRLSELVLQEKPVDESLDVARKRQPALIREAGINPDMALASATRELLRMSETVEVMLQPVMEIYESYDKLAIKQIKELEPDVNRANKEIKLYLAGLDWDAMDAAQRRRGEELTSFAINLEQAGDIIVKQLLKLAEQKYAGQLKFSEQGWRELTDLHTRVLDNMQLSLNVLVSSDREAARQIIAEKDDIGALERESVARHLTRLRSGSTTSRESSDLHIETIHALKRINSLMSGIAYSILADSGDLLGSRLSKTAGA